MLRPAAAHRVSDHRCEGPTSPLLRRQSRATRRDAHLHHIVEDPHLDDIIEAKNQSVRGLQQELEGMIAAHQDLVQAAEEKMAEYGVPMEELGFTPQSLGVTAAEG